MKGQLGVKMTKRIELAEQYKIYLASGWFNSRQMETMDLVRDLLSELGFVVYAPYYDGLVLSKESTEQERKNIFMENLRAIRNSDMMIAVVDDFETGTVWEMGYAYGALKQDQSVVLFSAVPGRGLNVMLQQSCDCFVIGVGMLEKSLRNFVENGNFIWSEVGGVN